MSGDHPKKDIFGMSIDYGDTYYITLDEEVVHPLNTDEYFIQVLKAQVFQKNE